MFGGAIKLFRLAGIQVSLHFTWFLVAAYEITTFASRYQSPIFAAYEYVGLFVIILMHEFGHALACRQVGGEAHQIVLWPLGGVAFVNPPQRPGAVLWSIAAGPLVNVALIPIFAVLMQLARARGLYGFAPDSYRLLYNIQRINFVILIFNLLPIYPLDGGQILRALLWFPFGAMRSLQVASVVGVLGSAGLGLLALSRSSVWLGFLAFFLLSQAIQGFKRSRQMVQERDLVQPIDPAVSRPIDV